MSSAKWHYSPPHLFLLSSLAAIVLAAFHQIGFAATYFAVVVGVMVIPFFWHPRWLYVWLLPLLWLPIAWCNYYHCGDEYGGFMIGSIAGFWIVPFLSMNSPAAISSCVIIAGLVTVATAGGLLDRLTLRWSIWFVLWLATTMFIFAKWFGSYPSIERALAKNGSYETYVFTSVNFGLTAATIIGIFLALTYRCFLWTRHRIIRDSGCAT
jgi:hypothetical protein